MRRKRKKQEVKTSFYLLFSRIFFRNESKSKEENNRSNEGGTTLTEKESTEPPSDLTALLKEIPKDDSTAAYEGYLEDKLRGVKVHEQMDVLKRMNRMRSQVENHQIQQSVNAVTVTYNEGKFLSITPFLEQSNGRGGKRRTLDGRRSFVNGNLNGDGSSRRSVLGGGGVGKDAESHAD